MLEQPELVLINSLPEAPVVIDGGMGWGEYTQAVLDARPKALVYGFEPHPLHMTKLASRFWKYTDNVFIYPRALWKVDGHVIFHIDGHPEHKDFGSSVHKRAHHAGQMLVPAVKLAYLHPTPIDLLKLDVEGAELDALIGMGELRPTVIQFEYSINTWTDAGNKLENAVRLLETWGYQFDSIPPRDCQYTNIVARRTP